MLKRILDLLCKLAGCERARKITKSVREVPQVQQPQVKPLEHPGDKFHVRTNERVKIGDTVYRVYLHDCFGKGEGQPNRKFILTENRLWFGLIPGTYEKVPSIDCGKF